MNTEKAFPVLTPIQRRKIYERVLAIFEQFSQYERSHICKLLEIQFIIKFPEFEFKYFRVSEQFPEMAMLEPVEGSVNYGWWGIYRNYYRSETKEHQKTVLALLIQLARTNEPTYFERTGRHSKELYYVSHKYETAGIKHSEFCANCGKTYGRHFGSDCPTNRGKK